MAPPRNARSGGKPDEPDTDRDDAPDTANDQSAENAPNVADADALADAQLAPFPGSAESPITEELAMAATARTDPAGNELSEDARRVTADRIRAAAAANASWRASRPLDEQFAMAGTPVIAVPES